MASNDLAWRSAMDRAHDPEDSMNGARYHTGLPCIERGCTEPAGTAWGPHLCQHHNAERLDLFSRRLAEMSALVAGSSSAG